jgi:hypothetical protein
MPSQAEEMMIEKFKRMMAIFTISSKYPKT